MSVSVIRKNSTPIESFEDSCRRLTRIYSSIKPETPFLKIQGLLEYVSTNLPKAELGESINSLVLIDNRNLDIPYQNYDIIAQHYFWINTSILRIRFPKYTSDSMGIELDSDLEIVPPSSQNITFSTRFVDRYSNSLDAILEKEGIKF